MAASSGPARWSSRIRQVTKSNFPDVVKKMRAHIEESDFVAVSTRPTGAFTSAHRLPWRRILPIDTPEIAYLKAKLAAESFEILQFAVCPFRIRGRKVHAFPYNFHLFPRDELNLGMPSYSFSCQSSFLTSMAREGFDFNVCINDGISYLSRVQESRTKERNTIPQMRPTASSSNPSVADSLFMGRIKSRVELWRKTCKERGKEADGSLIKSLKKLILGKELFGSRPCLTIDVCNDRQVQLALEVVNKIGDLVPLVAAEKGGESMAVRVVLTSSDQDKHLLMSEIQALEDEQNLKVRGFREVIDLISSSYKPIIAYNCLQDFTYIHSMFLGPLPPSLAEFACSLKLAFANILDVDHLSKEVGPLKRAKNLPATLSYLDRQFFAPIEFEISHKADEGKNEKKHGHNVLRITSLFAKLSSILKIDPNNCQATSAQHSKSIEDYANVFYPTCTSFKELEEEDDSPYLENIRKKVSTDNLVFLWGFGKGVAVTELKRRLRGSHRVLSDDFELRTVDKTCAVLLFYTPDSAKALLEDMRMESGGCDALKELMSEGLKGADYDAYKKVCRLGLWEADLADSLDAALAEAEPADELSRTSQDSESEIYWNSELMIDLNEL